MELGAQFLWHHKNALAAMLREEHIVDAAASSSPTRATDKATAIVDKAAYFSRRSHPFGRPWVQSIAESFLDIQHFYLQQSKHDVGRYEYEQLKALSWGELLRGYEERVLKSTDDIDVLRQLKRAVFDLAIRYSRGRS